VAGTASLDGPRSTLLKEWRELNEGISRRVAASHFMTMFIHAHCTQRARRRLCKLTVLAFTDHPGCQATIQDELDWSLWKFAVVTLMAALPLLAYWFYERFSPNRTVLMAQPPYLVTRTEVAEDGASDFHIVDVLPLPVILQPTKSHQPMVSQLIS